ncbi:MAG: putative quinol monooxygenase [Acidiferrobacterales bacterium]
MAMKLSRREVVGLGLSSLILGCSASDEPSPGESMSRFGMHVKMAAHPGKRDELSDIMLKASRLMSEANGCELYIVHLSPDQPGTIWITEVWSSKEAHDASLSVPGVQDLILLARPLIAEMTPTLLQPLGGHGLD